jgi:hypothetical protein
MNILPVEDLSNSGVIPRIRAFTRGSRDLPAQDALSVSLCAPCGESFATVCKSLWDNEALGIRPRVLVGKVGI